MDIIVYVYIPLFLLTFDSESTRRINNNKGKCVATLQKIFGN